jgi:pSer/pThr/pTyr-binding forkhead associated (FHA) protein
VDPIRTVAEAIVNLGIADELTLAAHIRTIRERPVTESTADDNTDADHLLDLLQAKGVVTASQRDLISKIQRGEATPRAAPEGKPDPYVGKVFGRWKTLEKIGEGGMGAVYRAERQDDGSKDYVIKVLSPLGADASTYVRFQREGEVMAALRHPNVVRVYTSGQVDGLSFIAMEFVDGPTLQEIFERRTRFDWESAAKAARQIALALEAAHSIGVIHRDVKPQNVLLSRAQGLLKVADFGLAKIMGTVSDPAVSRAGDILGSPAYIAPEQWGDHDVDRRADLFALGVVLYQLVTGVLPFRGRTPAEYSRKILAGTYDAVELYAPETNEGLKQVIARLLERRRENRYESAGQVIADLERILRNELPDVPRLVRSQGGTVDRFVLLGRDQFLVGRAAPSQVALAAEGVVDRHAILERSPAGLILRELDGKGLVRVNGMRIREITLKDNDVIEFAQAPPLRYRAGARPQAAPPSSAPSPGSSSSANAARPATGTFSLGPVSVPAALYEAFVRDENPRAVLALIELLDDATWWRRALRGERRLLALGLDPDIVKRARERALAGYRRFATSIPDRLFRATHENLGSDPASWLGWWFTSGRERFPGQAGPPEPRATGALALVVQAGTGARIVPLTGLERWVLGRGSECEVHLEDRSVSRKHATIYRLLTRFAIRDEGSRFGTLIRGDRRAVALLRHDDAIELGRARALFRQPDEPETGSAEDSARGIDAFVFDGLVELRSPHVAGALVSFLDIEATLAPLAAVKWEGQEPGSAVELARGLVEDRRRVALETLPHVAKKNLGKGAAAWKTWWAEARSSSGTQVFPEGWTLTI